MLSSPLLALFLPCFGMAALFLVYFCLLRCAISGHPDRPLPLNSLSPDGLSASELHQLPTITGQDLLTPTECAVCLGDIDEDHPVRLIPACNHAFHLECADTWLSHHRLCPLCKANLHPQLFTPSQNSC
ncbi:E3 ubiquitin-protein ligase ATL23-like [Neltuma alba]|uniref:E3 ubiquitin-protein ligase ATL23-like n=1 Tax=Neltuma alba TaxID=207710 RepID=UPI0010A50FAD|nr:E3 ubiquitin-protein ligase ATL23-like [Prosopis alba]